MFRRQTKLANSLLGQSEQTQMLIGPRMHLTLLLNGEFQLDYAQSIAGILNLATVLADLKRNDQLAVLFSGGQQVAALLLAERRLPSQSESEALTNAFNGADRFIRKQNKASIVKALLYINKAITSGTAISPKDFIANHAA